MRLGLRNIRARMARQSLPEYIRVSGDVADYRRFHARLAFYEIIACHSIVGDTESAVRWSSVIAWLLGFLVFYYGGKSLDDSRKNRGGHWRGIVSAEPDHDQHGAPGQSERPIRNACSADTDRHGQLAQDW